METSVHIRTFTASQIVQALMNIRHEWEEAARGDSLLEIEGCVGRLLVDVANALGLSPEEFNTAVDCLADDYRDSLGE